MRDFWTLFQACLLSSLLLVVLLLYIHRFQGFPRSAFVIDGMLTFLLSGGLRVSIRTLYRYRDNLNISRLLTWQVLKSSRSKNFQEVLIVGAGDAGEKLLREVIENPNLAYNVLGFLDNDRGKKGRSLHGVPILGTLDDLGKCIDDFRVNSVLVAMPSASGKEMRHIVTTCEDRGVMFKTLPSLGEIVNGKVSVNHLREINYEDLLGREEVHLDYQSIREYIQNKVVLVTGAGGSIGSELCRQIVQFMPNQLILVDSSEYNLHKIHIELLYHIHFKEFVPVLTQIQNAECLEHIFQTYKPSIIFHAAAYKHVPLLEDNPWQAIFNNVYASHVLMKMAYACHVDKVVIVSTDKAVRPRSVMGATKRITELMMQLFNRQESGAPRFMAVRFGNVVGSSGSVIPLFQKQIQFGGPVTVTHPEVTRYFMTISEASQLILQAGALGQGGEIFILDMGKPIKIVNMARDLIRLMGKDPEREIEIVFSGLRPGEKIAEELISTQESVIRTAHDKILVVDSGANRDNPKLTEAQRELEKQINELYHKANALNSYDIRMALKALVSEYIFDEREM